MKKSLLIILCLAMFSVNAQTTHDLDWYTGIGSNVNLTIDVGDTVRWTWTSPSHTVTSLPSSTETFDSGFLGPNGSTFSYTFTLEGSNPYYCEIHGTASMSGTITVNPVLGIDEKSLFAFNMFPNPSNSRLHLDFPQIVTKGTISVFNVLGKEYLTKNFENTNSVELNISYWSNGVYLIKVKSKEGVETKQFIKN